MFINVLSSEASCFLTYKLVGIALGIAVYDEGAKAEIIMLMLCHKKNVIGKSSRVIIKSIWSDKVPEIKSENCFSAKKFFFSVSRHTIIRNVLSCMWKDA